MVDILHGVGIKGASPAKVYEAIATRDGVAAWWSTRADGDSAVGEVLRFWFDVADASIDVKVIELEPSKRVRWEVVGGPNEWLGTTISFELLPDGDYTRVLFKHEGWSEPVEFMHHCSTKWGVFMLSLKQLVETGTGAPAPYDVKIDNWN